MRKILLTKVIAVTLLAFFVTGFVVAEERVPDPHHINKHITHCSRATPANKRQHGVPTETTVSKKISNNKRIYKVIWKFKIKPESKDRFEKAYCSDGTWAQLFKQAPGYIETEFLRVIDENFSYVTIDTWRSREDYERFKTKWQEEYQAFDKQCEDLTVTEIQIGSFEVL